jgi:adenylate cyclase
MADAIDKLLDLGIAAVGVDILYDSHGVVEEYDERLVEAVGRSDRVVMGAFGLFEIDDVEELEFYDYIVPFDELDRVANTAFLNVIQDPVDGAIRKAIASVRYGDTMLTSFPIEIYKTYRRSLGLDDSIDIPVNRFGQYNIDYAGKPNAPDSYTVLSFWGLINDEYPEHIFQNSIALIGPYALGIGMDNYFTPIDRAVKMYGIEVHANTLQNLIEGNFKRDVEWHWELVKLGFFALLSALLFIKLKPIWAAVATLGMIGLQLLAAKVMYDQFGLVLVSSYTLILLILAYFAQQILSVAYAQHEKAHIRGLFGRFVAPEVVREIIAGNVSVSLGGVLRDVTILFVDIRGFTAFSEANPPEKVVEIVNRYLDLTSSSIQNNGGTIDKYIGDATMAIFNAPNDLDGHALCAVRAAWEMKKGSETLRKEILRDFDVELEFGIGVNTGQAIVGNMGSEFRMDYTVIGDTVNTAARLESSAQKGQIIISDAVYRQVKNYVDAEDLGLLTVKNKKEGIHIYEVYHVYGSERVEVKNVQV